MLNTRRARNRLTACLFWTFLDALVALCALWLVRSSYPKYTTIDVEWLSLVSFQPLSINLLNSNSRAVKIALFMFVGEDNGGFELETYNHLIRNKREYCDRHGYALELITKKYTDRPFHQWQRIPMILHLLFPNDDTKAYDWVWALDLETLIMRQDLSVQEHLIEHAKDLYAIEGENVGIIASEDCIGVYGTPFSIW